MNIGMLLDNEFTADPRVSNEAKMLAMHHQVHVICLNYGEQKSFEQQGNIFVHRLFIPEKVKKIIFLLQFYLPFFQWFWFFHSWRIIRKYKIGALHAHDLYMARPALMLKKFLHLPIVLDLHENYPAALEAYTWTHKPPAKWLFKADTWKNLEFRLLSGVDGMIVLSNHYRKYLAQKYPQLDENKILIYPNVPVLKEFERFPTYNGGYEFMKQGFWLVYFGVVGRRRGILAVMEALAQLSNPEIKLLVIGPLDKHDREEFLSKLGELQEKGSVVYFPWKDVSELPSMLHFCSLALSPIIKNPQHESGVANKVFQYMLAGKAILVSDCQPQLEIVEECQCGLYFRDGDLDDLMDKILWCYHHPEELKRMGENGRKAVIEKYNTDIQYKSVLTFYQNLQPRGQQTDLRTP